MKYNISFLPPDADLETKAVLKKLPAAHRRLAELKGISSTIPNETILINTLIFTGGERQFGNRKHHHHT